MNSENKSWQNGRLHIFNANNQLHNEEGPAFETIEGTKQWFINNKNHREDGPARIYADGGKFWFINGRWIK